MDEITGITASLPSEAANSTANNTTTPMTNADSIGYTHVNSQHQQNHVDVYTNPGQAEADVPVSERTIPIHELRAMLRQQLEYYFSRENLVTDAYLRSQMDGDQYVPIATIANFNQVRRLTKDLSLIVEALRESPYVQVDEAGEKVRPSQRSIVLILREIPESTPIKDFEELFSGENCPKFSRCEFAHNDTWYVLFETDEDAKTAYCYLREEAKTFNGKPVMARIKASLTSAPYSNTYKNGVVSPPNTEPYNQQPLAQPPQQQQQQAQPQQQPPPPQQQQQSHIQYTYANVHNENFSNQQICPPFYPPTMLQAWAPSTASCVDLGAVFSMNGLSPQAAYRPITNASKSTYSVRDRPVKSFNSQQTYANRSDQSSRYYGRNQSYIPRQQQQQQQQQTQFHSVMNAGNFDYLQYPSGSRNLHSFGFESLNIFSPPNICFRKIPAGPSTYASQTRHNTIVLPRNTMGVGAINTPDQSYVGVGNTYSKDAAIPAPAKQNMDSQGKDNWTASQKPSRKKWSKENGTNTSSKGFSENTSDFFKPVNGNVAKPESPKFDLETTSFPPLPGCMDTDVLDVDVYESRLSDIVKGTVKPSTRDTKTQTVSDSCLKDNSTIAVDDAVECSDGAFTPPATTIPEVSSLGPVANESIEKWVADSLSSEVTNEVCALNNSISSTTQTTNENVMFSSIVTHTTATNTVLVSPVSAEVESTIAELDNSSNVPNESEKPTPAKAVVKAKAQSQQPETVSKNKTDVQSPKTKVPESIGRNKQEANKEYKASGSAKHRAASFSSNKSQDSSISSKDRGDSQVTAAAEPSAAKNVAEVFSAKDKVHQNHPIPPPVKGRSFDLPSKVKGPETEPTVSFISVNGHIDSESTISSEDEKPFRKLTYSEVAMRAKDKVEKLAQELKEKERQEAIVRYHRQQEITAQSRQGGPFREFPRRVSERPGARDWRDRRKPPRAVSLPSTGQ